MGQGLAASWCFAYVDMPAHEDSNAVSVMRLSVQLFFWQLVLVVVLVPPAAVADSIYHKLPIDRPTWRLHW